MAKWNKSETLLLLTLYEQHPFLYKTTDRNYMNKGLRRQRLDEICKELKKVKADVTVEEIKLKIKTLRSQLQKEKKIIQYSKKADPSANAEYVPTLWSYRHIQFLDDHLDDESPDASNAESTAPTETITTEVITFDELDHEVDASEKSFKSTTTETSVKRKDTDNFREEATKAFEFAKSYAEEILENRVKRKPDTKEDVFTKYLCEQLKLIQSENNYEDTTWKILQVVREGIRKDRHERKEGVKLKLSHNSFNLTPNKSSTSSHQLGSREIKRVRSFKNKGIFDKIL